MIAKQYFIALALCLAGCAVGGKGPDVSAKACRKAISSGPFAPPYRKVNSYLSYSDEAPPAYYKLGQSQYREQLVAGYYGFAFNDVYAADEAEFIARSVASRRELDLGSKARVLYSNELCVLGQIKGQIEYRYISGDVASRPKLAGACYGSFMLYFAGVAPTLADSLLVFVQPKRQLVDAGDWDVVVQVFDENRVGAGLNRDGPLLGCLLKAREENLISELGE